MPKFESTLHGTLLMCSVYTHHDARSGNALYTHLRIMAKQANGLMFEAVQVVGSGPDAVTRATVMKGRLRPGVQVEVHADAVCIVTGADGDPPRLFLQNVDYIRSQPDADQARTASNVHSILHRLAERVPAVARGMHHTSHGV